MTALKKRAQALENQFAHQAEIQFKARVRGSKMLGRWAAYTMGLDDVEAYARTVAVKQVIEKTGQEASFLDAKALGAFQAQELERWGKIIRRANIKVE